MGLSREDVREILRLIDESELDELRLETPELQLHVRRGGKPSEEAEPVPGGDADAERTPEQPTDGVLIKAPMLGTFYRAEAPGQPPLVDVGSPVEPGKVVCLIEVMKLMNHISSEVAGTVVEVLAKNDELVEFDQPLFRVAPG